MPQLPPTPLSPVRGPVDFGFTTDSSSSDEPPPPRPDEARRGMELAALVMNASAQKVLPMHMSAGAPPPPPPPPPSSRAASPSGRPLLLPPPPAPSGSTAAPAFRKPRTPRQMAEESARTYRSGQPDHPESVQRRGRSMDRGPSGPGQSAGLPRRRSSLSPRRADRAAAPRGAVASSPRAAARRNISSPRASPRAAGTGPRSTVSVPRAGVVGVVRRTQRDGVTSAKVARARAQNRSIERHVAATQGELNRIRGTSLPAPKVSPVLNGKRRAAPPPSIRDHDDGVNRTLDWSASGRRDGGGRVEDDVARRAGQTFVVAAKPYVHTSPVKLRGLRKAFARATGLRGVLSGKRGPREESSPESR